MSKVALGDELERRTCKWLESVGYKAERVSRRARFGGRDLFGCVDLVAVSPEAIILGQVTTKNGASARRKKIRESGLQWPVMLFIWFKHKNRWTFISEEIAPFALRSTDDDANIERPEAVLEAPTPGLTSLASCRGERA